MSSPSTCGHPSVVLWLCSDLEAALQLAAALAFAQDDPRGVELVTLDPRLAAAARREGLKVLPS